MDAGREQRCAILYVYKRHDSGSQHSIRFYTVFLFLLISVVLCLYPVYDFIITK